MVGRGKTYLSCRFMQHPDILRGNNMHQRARLHMSDLDKARLKRQDVRIAQRERGRLSLPCDLPVRARAPSVAVDVEREVGVVEQELAVQAIDGDGLDVFFAGDEVERGVGRVEEGLRLEGFHRDDFEAAGAADAELGFEEVDGGGFGRDVDFLRGVSRVSGEMGYCDAL